MERGMANLRIEDSEEEAWSVHGDGELLNQRYEFCLVGCFLTASVINSQAMQNTIANLWHSLGGVLILYLGEKCFIFKFYHELDIGRVENGAPWTFTNHLIVFHRLKDNEEPMQVPLISSYFWLQIHDLHSGLFSENMARQFGSFVGKFVEYDAKQIGWGIRNYMRVRVLIDVFSPLKRRKKIILASGAQVYAKFQYEKLSLFFLVCGRLGHGDSFCPTRLHNRGMEMKLGRDLTLRAPVRRANIATNVWLREDDSGDVYGKKIGGRNRGSDWRNENQDKMFSD
ncbi:hypothetical protein Gogos_009109 [Gossypium gossypioides]|uniref:DUF4283 domain-containing protein n=1 Tax=Gossypium gossypioides TaxID=34282 RepID=A0A7J9CDX2_GOSGO|nr:hypothetical protein [Gossypium gossypioides]